MNARITVPLVQVQVSDAAKRRVRHVLDSGRLASGPVVAELEDAFARASGTRQCVAVSNGTLALQAGLAALGVGPGDEVITSPFTFVATVNAILAQGATVRFADITADYTLDPDHVAAAVRPATKAILPVHLFGLPADMASIGQIAAQHGVAVLEDAAQAHGAALVRADGSLVAAGGMGRLGCFSLYATKNLSAGEGGLVTTDEDDLADAVRVIRNQGMRARYEYVSWGSNYRMSDLHAAVVVDQVHQLARINHARRANAEQLLAGLADLPGLELPIVPADRAHVWHQFTVRLRPGGPVSRTELLAGLAERGVGADVFYPHAMTQVPHLGAHPRVLGGPMPRAEDYAGRVMSLPVGHHLRADQIDRVIEATRAVCRG